MDKWKMVRLGDICEVKSGGTPKKDVKEYYENGTIPWVKTGDLKYKNLINTSENISNKGLINSSAKLFPIGTVLIAMYGATIGACSILRIEASTNQACAALLPTKALPSEYLYYYFSFIKNDFVSLGVGGAQSNISGTIIKNLKIPLPPLPVQEQIVQVLDHVSALIEKRKTQIEKLDVLVKSQFIEMFGDPVLNPKGWEKGTIRDIVADVKYGTSKLAVENGEYIYLRMNNITYSGHIDLSDLKYINVPEKDYEKYVVRKGDVLFNRTNSKELVGKTAVFKEKQPMIIAGYIIRVRTNKKASPEYLSSFLNSHHGKQLLFDMCKSIVGQANINAQELQNISILIPPMSLQNQYADFVEKVEAQKVLLQQTLEKLEENYQSLLQKCFRGEIF